MDYYGDNGKIKKENMQVTQNVLKYYFYQHMKMLDTKNMEVKWLKELNYIVEKIYLILYQLQQYLIKVLAFGQIIEYHQKQAYLSKEY